MVNTADTNDSSTSKDIKPANEKKKLIAPKQLKISINDDDDDDDDERDDVEEEEPPKKEEET